MFNLYVLENSYNSLLYSRQIPLKNKTTLSKSCSLDGLRCKKSGYFTKSVKNITNGVFICHKQVNNDTKNNNYSLKRQ